MATVAPASGRRQAAALVVVLVPTSTVSDRSIYLEHYRTGYPVTPYFETQNRTRGTNVPLLVMAFVGFDLSIISIDSILSIDSRGINY